MSGKDSRRFSMQSATSSGVPLVKISDPSSSTSSSLSAAAPRMTPRSISGGTFKSDTASIATNTTGGGRSKRRVGRKRANGPHELFVIVRPPPSKKLSPLQLQIQLVTPSSSTPKPVPIPIPAPETTVEENEDEEDPSRSRSNSIKSSQSQSSAISFGSSNATSSSAGHSRRLIPLYNLNWHSLLTTFVTDASTDVKIANFKKKGLEILELAVLEPLTMHNNSEATSSFPSSPSSPNALAVPSPVMKSASTSNVETRGGPASASPDNRTGFIGRLFNGNKASTNSSNATSPSTSIPVRRRSLSFSSSTRANSSNNSSTSQPFSLQSFNPFANVGASPHTNMSASTFGLSPIVTLGRSGRPTGYAWVIRKWLRSDGDCPVIFEWNKMYKSKSSNVNQVRRDSNQTSNLENVESRPDSIPSDENTNTPDIAVTSTTSSPSRRSIDSSRPGSMLASSSMICSDSDGEPEDRENPWTCTLVYADCRVHLGTLSPALHHPKLIGQIHVPLPLPDIVLATSKSVHSKSVISGVNPLQQGKKLMDAVVDGVAALTSNNSPSPTPTPIPKSSDSAIGPSDIRLSAEDLKDVMCCTCLWIVVRESFGGLSERKK